MNWQKANNGIVVEPLGTVICDVSMMPRSAFKIKRSGFFFQNAVSRVSYTLEMKVGATDLELDMIYAGKSYGKATIEY